MRERILRNVLLPAPLRPMTATTSPCLISQETSRNAQVVVSGSIDFVPDHTDLTARNGLTAASAKLSRKVRYRCFVRPIRYSFDSAFVSIATLDVQHPSVLNVSRRSRAGQR